MSDPSEGRRRGDEQATDEEDNYYAAVESYFVVKRGSPLFITPAEWHLIQKWDHDSIPLSIVEEGIDRAFENPRARQRARKLSYCRQSVEAANRRFREARIGGELVAASDAPQVTPPDDEARLLDLSKALTATAARWRETVPELAERLIHTAESIDRLRSSSRRSSLELEKELAELEAELLSAGESLIDEAALEEIRELATASLEAYRDRMPASVYRAALLSAIRKRLRSKLGTLPLSLFGL